jgi:hypothetical protein
MRSLAGRQGKTAIPEYAFDAGWPPGIGFLLAGRETRATGLEPATSA